MAPTVLVLGGVGFIGRNFVAYLVENNLASEIRVVDKALPATAYLSDAHKKIFEDKRVDFRQANLVNPGEWGGALVDWFWRFWSYWAISSPCPW